MAKEKFDVLVTVTTVYTICVEAEDRFQAEEIGKDIFFDKDVAKGKHKGKIVFCREEIQFET